VLYRFTLTHDGIFMATAVDWTVRYLSAPWTVEETQPCFIVRGHNGQALAFVYCEEEPGRRTTAKMLTREETRRIAANIAKLPELRNPLIQKR
jgi:hypothetical protein